MWVHYNEIWAQSPLDMIIITEPVQNQQVPAGDLIVKGTSLDDANSDCTVYVSLNDLEPFQKATANGPRGQNDYSSWAFTYTKEYYQIAQGPNKLTARLSCPNSEAHSSVDIVGTLLPPGGPSPGGPSPGDPSPGDPSYFGGPSPGGPRNPDAWYDKVFTCGGEAGASSISMNIILRYIGDNGDDGGVTSGGSGSGGGDNGNGDDDGDGDGDGDGDNQQQSTGGNGNNVTTPIL